MLAAGPLLAQSAESGRLLREKGSAPFFATKCYACHGAGYEDRLDFASGAGFEQVIAPGDAAHSRLYRAIGYADKIKMPPAGKLPDQEIADLKAWIEMGAPLPKALTATPISGTEIERIREGRKFWAFQPVKDYAPPRVKNETWVRTPVDRFILAKLEEKNIRPAAPASKLTLLRRATYDLTGLPPTTEGDRSSFWPTTRRTLCQGGGSSAGVAAVRRALGAPLAGRRARYADSTGMDEDHIIRTPGAIATT